METDWKEQMEQMRSQQKGYVTEEGILDETGWEAGENSGAAGKGWMVCGMEEAYKKDFFKKEKMGRMGRIRDVSG